MRIKFIEIQNFRRLKSVRIDFAEETTLFVGANNSGKTSAMVVLGHFLIDKGRFTTKDFTLSTWNQINKIGKTWQEQCQKNTPLSLSDNDVENSLEEGVDPVLEAWEAFLATPFLQIEFYQNYVTGRATFETHQGVKGLEYPRVMVVIDNSETRGFLFNYEKFIGAESLTSTDTKNESEGKETSNDRTRRLFYVTCSRAQRRA